MTETDQTVDEIVSVLTSLVRHSGELSDSDLDEQISKRLPEPSATDPRPVPARPAVVHSVAVQGIRSFGPEQTLRLSEGLTIVYAGNGKGKTSLTDAFELVAGGVTTRKIGLPNAASEVHDKDHITHRTRAGIADHSHPPRVTVRFHDGSDLRECEWNVFNSPAPRHPDLQVLPRRLLRELVNAKRTERIGPLGAALGLAETSASWTAISKELGTRAVEARDGGEAYLQLLSEEVSLDGDDEAQLEALNCWALKHSTRPAALPDPPDAAAWRQLAQDLQTAESAQTDDALLDPQLTALLAAFAEVATPGSACPACAQAPVPEARLAEVEAFLDRSRAATELAATHSALRYRRDAIAAEVSAWLKVTVPPDRPEAPRPSAWSTAVDALQEAFDERQMFREEQWACLVAAALEGLTAARAQIVDSPQGDSSPERRRAVDAVTANAKGTLEALLEMMLRRTVIAPLLTRAQARTKSLLLARVNLEISSGWGLDRRTI